MQRITIITDAWEPQVNGVVRTYQNIRKFGDINIIHHNTLDFTKVKLPFYKEIDVVLNPWLIRPLLDEAMINKDKMHIATEGPLGLYANMHLSENGYSFSTCFHTNFPAYLKTRFKVPEDVSFRFYKWFHDRAHRTLVPSKQTIDELQLRGFKNLMFWSRGVDTEVFNPSKRRDLGDYILCVSRAAQEKGLDDFCKLDYPNKVLIGDGPYLNTLKKRYPDVKFLGKLEGEELAKWYASARVFVFPSKTDTFGVVLLESLACEVPVASYDMAGPKEVIENGINGYRGDNLQSCLDRCLHLDFKQTNLSFDWEIVLNQLTHK